MGSPIFSGFSVTDLAGTAPSGETTPVTVLAQGDTFSQARNTTRRYSITLVDPSAETPLVGIFTGSEALRAFVWEGGDGPTLATPAVSWADASVPAIFLDVMPADLATLGIMPYPIRVEVDRGGQWQEGWDGWVDVLYEPATATTLYAPGTYQEMVDKGGDSIKSLLAGSSRAGFLKERSDAWKYLRQVILARYRPIGGNRGGYGYGSGYGGGGGYWTSIDSPNVYIAAQLDAGYLLVTDQVKEVLARKALALLFDRQEDPAWSKRARTEHLRADWLIASLVAGIDTNADGYPDIAINCGILNTRDI